MAAGIGGVAKPRKDLRRWVRWPKYVRIQRQKRILNQRLKVPPAINRFTKTLDKNTAATLFKLLLKYRPEDKAAKKVLSFQTMLYSPPCYIAIAHVNQSLCHCYDPCFDIRLQTGQAIRGSRRGEQLGT